MNGKLVVSLDTLKKGDTAVIMHVGTSIAKEAELSSATHLDKAQITQIGRLLEMGFYEGATIKVMHFGIFGKDPIAVRFKGNSSMIAIRKKDAKIIFVNKSHA
jgi:Fe2+ transport system protein FeoA